MPDVSDEMKGFLDYLEFKNKKRDEEDLIKTKKREEEDRIYYAKREEASAKREEAMLARFEATQAKQDAALAKSDAEKRELLEKLSQLTIAANANENGIIVSLTAKYERVLNEFRRSMKVKEFSPVVMTVNDWLQSVNDEVKIISLSKGLDMSEMTAKQWIYIILSKLPQKIVAQLEAYCKREEKTFETVEYKRFVELFQKYGGISVPQVTAVINLFTMDRNTTDEGLPILHHILEFSNKLPTCFTPKDDNLKSLQDFHDLMKRAAFFASIRCPEIRKALMKIPESQATFLEFTKVAQETDELIRAQRSNVDTYGKLDGVKQNTTASVMKVDGNSDHKRVRNNNKRGHGGNRGGYRGGNRGGYRGGRGGSRNQSTSSVQSSSQGEIICHSCGAKGHKSPSCPNKAKKDVAATHNGNNIASNLVDLVQPGDSYMTPGVFSAGTIHTNTKRGDNIDMSLILNGKLQAMFEFDTGAGVCIIPKDLLKLFEPENCPEVEHCNMRLQLANGQQAEIIGTVQLGVVTSAHQRMKPISTRFYVVDGPHALIGRPLMRVLFPGLYGNIMQLSKAINCYHGDKKYIQVPTTLVVAKNDLISRNQGIGVATGCNSAESSGTENDGSSSGNIVPAIPAQVKPSTETPTVTTAPLCANLPDAPTGEVSQEEGNKFCKLIAGAHPTLFDGKQGTAKGFKAKIHLKQGAESRLKVMPPAKVPIGIKSQFNVQLDKMIETGTFVSGVGLKVASQVVPVVQKKGDNIKVRNCVNYKNTINPLIEDEPYNFPTTNEQIDKLKGEYYTCLDINGAFTHILLEEETQDLLIYSTDRGFVKPTRLPFGVKTAPAIFQSYMDRLLTGIPSCACIVDDICVTGSTPGEHFRNLEKVLHRLEEAGMKLNTEKCQFYLPNVKYLGRIISRDGQKMDSSAVDAIINMPAPTSRNELQSFLGYLSYVRRHVPALSHVTPVLSALLKKNIKFVWNEEHETAFQQCKKLAGNMATLTHFDEKKELVLTTDASPVGIGACLSHKFVEGKRTYLKPIAYASRSLTTAERGYAQIEREGLGVIWAVKYFRQFLYCRHFTLQTDCNALTKIFGSKNDMGGCALSRINRWCVDLMEYDFTAQHIKGDKNLVCDSLSRLPQPSTNSLLIEDNGCGLPGRTTEDFIYASVKCLSALPVVGRKIQCYKSEGVAHLALQGLPLTASDIAKATREDPLYGRVLTAVKTGVFDVKDKTLSPFTNMKDKLTVDTGCLLFGSRVIIPTRQQARLLFELHITHMGVVKMKSLAREYIWWPGINKEIESMAAKCTGCAKYKKRPAPVPLTHWPWATRPMERYITRAINC